MEVPSAAAEAAAAAASADKSVELALRVMPLPKLERLRELDEARLDFEEPPEIERLIKFEVRLFVCC